MNTYGAHPLQARGPRRRYGHVVAVDGIDLTVHAGDIYGFLGPNGAGKTTAMRILLGLLRPDAPQPDPPPRAAAAS